MIWPWYVRALLTPVLWMLVIPVYAMYPIAKLYVWMYRHMRGRHPLHDQTVRSVIKDLHATIRQREQVIDATYTERARVISAFTRAVQQLGWEAGTALHKDETGAWDPEWLNIVYVDTPEGQVSWHIKSSDMFLFKHLQPYTKEWDGHTTEEKYRRLERMDIKWIVP